jgi:predicted ATPase
MTFLFTDIEGSTHRWETDPDGMRIALAAHDDVLRNAIHGNDGTLFKHTGDGVCAVFAAAPAAVEAAIEAQRTLELPVRMGIASGLAEARDGDYFGPALNRAARVMAAGHGGQILLADSTAALVDTSGYVDLGVHVLRDLNEPIRLFQVTGDAIPSEFAPLRTLSAVRGNLLATTATFVGREQQKAELIDTVHRNRLVTLTGPGGVGKTRLAAEVAAAVVSEFADGAWFVELAPTSDPASVPALVAEVLSITTRPNSSVVDSIVDALKGRQLLLVLDNCEHVVDAAGEVVRAIAENTDTVSILTTSREGLGVAGEQLWPVPTLDVDAGPESEAVALFIERARAANPQFATTPDSDDLEVIATVCRDLDGLALAIELAAARMVSMSPQDLAARLDHRLRLLSKAKHGMHHHRTLRSTVAWSYDLLDDDERSLLDRCAVFANWFELDSVIAICADRPWDDYTVIDLLDSLVRKSLVTADVRQERTRFHMLETIRQFGQEQLDEAGSTDLVRRAHAEHFAACAEQMWEVWNSAAQRTAIDWVDKEFADLRAAFRWATDHDEIELATRIASHAGMLSFVLQRFEPVTWVEEILEPATAADIDQLPRAYTAASVCGLTGGQEKAIGYAQTAVSLEGDPRYDGFQHGWSSYWEAVAHRYSHSVEQFLAICHELAEETGFAHVIGQCGLLGVLAGVGRPEEARAIADETLEAARDLGNPFWIAYAMTGWGRAHASQNPVAALEILSRSLAYTTEHRLDYMRAIVLREMATLEETSGGLLEALEKFSTVIEWYRASGNRGSVTTTIGDIAVMFDRLGRLEIAATVYGTSIPHGRSIAQELPTTVDHLREVLGDSRFDECVGVGSAMEFNDAMIYVRRVLDAAHRQLTDDG